MKIRPSQFVPGAISFSRILIGIAFPWLPVEWRLAAVIVAGFTDFLDGFASRLLKARSLWGRLLDPIADKIFFLAVLVTLLADGSLAWWQALLVCTRDLAVLLGCVIVLLQRGWSPHTRMRPRLLGKATTGLQILFVIALLWGWELVSTILCGATALASALSVVDYLVAFRREEQGQTKP